MKWHWNSFLSDHFGVPVLIAILPLLHTHLFFFLLALQPPLGVVFYSPLVGFSLLAYEVS